MPGEFLRARVSEPLGARAFVGVGQDELADYAPVNEIGVGFLFANSLLPNALGSGVDFNFIELVALFNNFRKMIGDFKPPFKEMDFNKGVGAFYNQVSSNSSVRIFDHENPLHRTWSDKERVAVPMEIVLHVVNKILQKYFQHLSNVN